MIIYDPLWKTMKKRKISQYRLITHYGVSSGQISRLRKNQYVSTHTIGVLCTILNCQVSDVMEFHMDNSENAFPSPEMYQEQQLEIKAARESAVSEMSVPDTEDTPEDNQ